MDTICLRTSLHGIITPAPSVPTNLDVIRTPKTKPASQFTARSSSSSSNHPSSANSISTEKLGASRFSFKYPFRSLFLQRGGNGNQRINGVTLDEADAVLVEATTSSNASAKEKERSVRRGRGIVNGGGDVRNRVEEAETEDDSNDEELNGSGSLGESQNGNWVLKILHVNSLWSSQENKEEGKGDEEVVEIADLGDRKVGVGITVGDEEEINVCCACEEEDDENALVDDIDDDEKSRFNFDRDSFSRLLKKVSLSEAKLYAKMSYLGNLAYNIPGIKPGNLSKHHGLRYVTSSIEKRELLASADKKGESLNADSKQPSDSIEEAGTSVSEGVGDENQKHDGYKLSASAAFHTAASAASYLHTRTRNILPFRSSKAETDQDSTEEASVNGDSVDFDPDMASFRATRDSVTAVVAAKEEVKQAVADDLNSISSSPCEWYICDDDQTATRHFVIQGSETMASWQANLLFEPIQFEGLDVFVHRGIYEAAKGMYLQMLPEVHAHMRSQGHRAKFRFTGHSLGGSLSLVINLMLLMRGEVPVSALLPVITFGAPCIMCGGDGLLRKLGLPKSHVQSVTMHRDIVPRAFACNYPNHVAQLLKTVNGSFRNHPCLNKQKLLYAPVGEMLILQPDAKVSPQHDLLPSGSGLYLLTCSISDLKEAEKLLRAAKNAFLNTPHPLETLSDRSAYGNGGTIQRDHDMNSYLKCVRSVIRQELNRIRKSRREHRRKVRWPLVVSGITDSGITFGGQSTPTRKVGHGQEQYHFSGLIKVGAENLKRFSRLVASQHMHLFVVLLFPARLLLIGAYGIVGFR